MSMGTITVLYNSLVLLEHQTHALCSELHRGLPLYLHAFSFSCLNSQVCKYCHLPVKQCLVRDCCMWAPTLPVYGTVQHCMKLNKCIFLSHLPFKGVLGSKQLQLKEKQILGNRSVLWAHSHKAMSSLWNSMFLRFSSQGPCTVRSLYLKSLSKTECHFLSCKQGKTKLWKQESANCHRSIGWQTKGTETEWWQKMWLEQQ